LQKKSLKGAGWRRFLKNSPAKEIETSLRRKTKSLSLDIDSATVVLFSSESMLPVPFWLFPEKKESVEEF
jgi:hypothetical protein